VTNHWTDCKLGEVVTFQRGFDLPQRERREGNVPIVTSSGITGYHDTAKAKAPGVVTGRYGTLGEVFYIREDYWPHNTALYIRDFKGNDPLFISYFLRTLKFAGQNVAGAVPGVNRNALHLLPVRVPSLPTQRKIAAILSAYDDLIENNTRRIRILEEMAQLLYREWFVHFRFPGHEGVKMKNGVPEGWEVMELSSACEFVIDGDWIETKDQGGADYRLLQVSNIGLGEFIETGNLRYISQETFERLKCREVVPGHILVSRMPEPIGRAWLVTDMPWRMITAVDVAIIKTDPSQMDALFCVYQLNSSEKLALFNQQATGTTLTMLD